MSAPECKHTEDLAAYAIGGLDDRDAAAVAAHLEECERCSETLEWLRPAVETLPESVEQLSPPPELRERLLAAAHADVEEGNAAPVRHGWRAKRLRIGGFAFGPATALATLLIAVAAAVGYAVGGPGGGDETQTIPVASRPAGSFADLEIKGDSATLQASGVPQLPPGAVYQVWVRTGSGALEASSVFRPNKDGRAAAAVPEAAHGADAVLVTREPGEGSPIPSGSPIYAATMPN
jgi:anti-sigma factor RsiW